MDHRDMENLCYLNIFQICQGNYEIEESKRQSKETLMCISNKSKLIKQIRDINKENFIMLKKEIYIDLKTLHAVHSDG